eukprot:Nk52_evm66s914 gene=Nk52_evmTU66s914
MGYGEFDDDYIPTGPRRPTCFDIAKSGAVLGATMGVAIGAVFGTVGAVRAGYRGKELVSVLGSSMIQYGGTFGLLMGVGSVVRGC